MTLATLAEVLRPALKGHHAVAGLVTLGWEDMRAYVAAAEAEGAPVILQAGPSCRKHTPLPVLGKMFRHLADAASVPVVAHLDHGYTIDECREALDVNVHAARAQGENVNEALVGPGGNVKSILPAACRLRGDAGRQQVRAVTPGRLLLEHVPHHAHELGNMLTQLPLPAHRQARNMTREVKLKAVQIMALRKLTQDA